MTEKNIKQFMTGTWLLSISSLITKILSAVYRVPLQNIVGNRGFFVYQQVYPLYGICTAIALTGIPMFVSQIIAEDQTKQNNNFQHLKVLMIWFSIISFIALFGLAPLIARGMSDLNLTGPIRVLSFFYLIAPFEALLRGSFQGELEMRPTAISQVAEQIIRVIIIIAAAIVYQKQHLSVYVMGSWAHGGSVIGGIFSVIILLYFFRKIHLTGHKTALNYRILIKRFLTEGLTLSLFSSLLVLYQMVDSFTIIRFLRNIDSQNIKGIFDRGQPIAQLGIVVAISFATAILPQLSAEQNAQMKQQQTITQTVHVSLFLAGCSAVGMAALMPTINTLLFKDASESNSLAIYVLAVGFISYAIVINAIMHAQRAYLKNILALIVSLIIKVGLNYFLIPWQGIIGASWATLIASMILAGSMYLNSSKILQNSLVKYKFLLKLLIVVATMGIIVVFLSYTLNQFWNLNRVTAIFDVLICIPVGVIVALIVSWKLKLLTTKEWSTIPGGRLLLTKLGVNK